jgi:hypothetical protein
MRHSRTPPRLRALDARQPPIEMEEAMTPTPRIFVAYAPRGAGLRCALAYFPSGRDAWGWFAGSGDAGVESAYFLLENFYTPQETRYVSVRDDDLHSQWTADETKCHQLAEMQEAFRREWLFSRTDPDAAAELAAYANAELAAGEVNLRFERLAKLSKLQPNWTYYSQDFERGVLKSLARHWPLDYAPDDD